MRIALSLIFVIIMNTAASKEAIKVVAAYLPDNMENRGRVGREAEIIQLIFKCMNITPHFDIQPFIRHVKSYNSFSYDAVLTTPVDMKTRGYDTQSYIAYNNGVIIREKEFPLGLTQLNQLKDKHVVTFVDGKEFLEGLKEVIPSFASYLETSDQMNHVEMLLKNRVDAVFSDGLIFMAHHKRLLQQRPHLKNIKIKFHGLFQASKFKASFKKKEHRYKFNSCLNKLSKNGKLDAIEIKYANKYIQNLGDNYLTPLLRKKAQ